MSCETPQPPERPSLSPALYALVTAILAERTLLGEGRLSCVFVAGGLSIMGVGALIWAWPRMGQIGRSTRELTTCCVCSLLAAVVVTGALLVRGQSFVSAMEASSVSRWSFEVLSDSLPTQGGYRCRARAFGGNGPDGQVWLSSSDVFERGDVIRGVGRFAPNDEGAWGRTSRMQGMWGSVKLILLRSRARVGGHAGVLLALRSAARRSLNPKSSDGRAVLAGCLIADRRFLVERGIDDLFAQCGVAHLVAVSGSHLVVIASLVSRVLGRVKMSPAVRISFLLALTGAFVLVCGAPPSAVRAWLMSVVSSVGTLLGRRGDSLSSVCLIALSMAIVDPSLSGQMGFLLSVACVVGLSLFSRYVAFLLGMLLPKPGVVRGLPSKVRIRLRSLRDGVVEGMAASLVCLVVSIPFVMTLTSRISLLGPFLSLPMSCLVSLAMSMGLVGCVAPIPCVGKALLWLADMLVEVALVVMKGLSCVPLASLTLDVSSGVAAMAIVTCALVVLVVWPVPSGRMVRRVMAIMAGGTVVCCLMWTVFAPARVCVLDVGQGDAILVQDGWHAILIDTGPDDSIARALVRKHVLRLDAVVLTHLHDDHYGGVDDLVGVVPCREALVAEGVAENVPPDLAEALRNLTGGHYEELSYGDVLRVGRFTLSVIWPHDRVTGDSNPDSLIMVVEYHADGRSLTALLTGDAELEELDAVMASGDLPDVDVLKVGHHGSEVSITPDQAKTLRAEVAIASAGRDNPYGHPKEECVKTLVESGSRFICTADAGDVEIRPGARGVRCLTDVKGG